MCCGIFFCVELGKVSACMGELGMVYDGVTRDILLWHVSIENMMYMFVFRILRVIQRTPICNVCDQSRELY